jgi:hypothetical protein
MVHGGEGSMVLISDDEGRERGRGPLNFSDDGGRERERARRACPLSALREECSTISVVRLYRHHLFSEKSQ